MRFPCSICGRLQGYQMIKDKPPYTIKLRVCDVCYSGEEE
jgi:hypothetical protein